MDGINERLIAHMARGLSPTEAARLENVHHSKATRLKNKSANRPPPIPDQFSTYVKIHGTARCKVRVKEYKQPIPTGKITKVVFVTDSHDSPEIPQDRFTWIGKFIADSNPDYFVHGGDFATINSVSRFDSFGTITGNERSQLQAEIDSLKRAVDLLCEPLEKSNCKAKRIITFGNHDERLWLHENQHPELEGMLWSQIENAFGEKDFITRAYKTWQFIEGVGFTHAPINAAGKPYAAKHPENSIANDAAFSVCYGHTHRSVAKDFHKLGPANKVTMFNPGCSLPHGHVEDYARLGMAGWAWGIGELYIQEGMILGHSIIPMLELERRYRK